jgi:hypothetical protein
VLWSLSEGVGGVFGFASRPCQHQVVNMGPAKSVVIVPSICQAIPINKTR